MPVVAIDHNPEHIGERFVKGAGLETVLQIDGARDDAMGNLVGNYV